jgi:Zn-dependent protease with chaperone function
VTFDPRLPRDDVNVSKTHPLAEAGWLLAAALAAGLLLALLAFAATEVVARWLPPQAEARLFGNLFDAMAVEGGQRAQDEKADRASALLARLAAHWPENPYTFRLVVAPDESLNAFALPGGTIAVTRGLLDAV